MANTGLIEYRRIHSLFIFIGIFGMIGGLALLRSYAARYETNTKNPGVYDLSDFTGDRPGEYDLDLTKDLLYCFSPSDKLSNTSITITSPSYSFSVPLAFGPNNTQCFIPEKSYEAIRLKLPGQVGQATTLTVSVP